MKTLGNRIKENYEKRNRHFLIRRMPVIIRVDGRAFHTFTRVGFSKPFDSGLIATMVSAASDVFRQAQGCKCAYIQSDEASFLLTDYDTLNTEAWFGYNQSKLESITASIMTASFNSSNRLPILNHKNSSVQRKPKANFDSRAFNIPKEEVVNYFLWRMLDWERNSVQMYCNSFFSHKEMQNKSLQDQHDMLHSIGKNWSVDCSDQIKNGTWIFPPEPDSQHYFSMRTDIRPNFNEIFWALNNLINCEKGI